MSLAYCLCHLADHGNWFGHDRAPPLCFSMSEAGVGIGIRGVALDCGVCRPAWCLQHRGAQCGQRAAVRVTQFACIHSHELTLPSSWTAPATRSSLSASIVSCRACTQSRYDLPEKPGGFSMTRVPVALGVAIVALVTTLRLVAVTRLKSADGQFWDIQDTSTWAQDSGGIATGGRANPFNGFGYLKLQVRRPDGGRPRAQPVPDGLRPRARRRRAVRLHHPGLPGTASSSRARSSRRGTRTTCATSTASPTSPTRPASSRWRGAARPGAFEDGGRVAVATTSSGDRRIEPGDTFVTVMQNAKGVDDPMSGPSGHGPSAHVLGSQTRRAHLASATCIAIRSPSRGPGDDPAHIGYVFRFTLKPGQTTALVTFVVKGLSEVYDPRGGFPVPIRNGMIAPQFDAVVLGRRRRHPGGRHRDCARHRRGAAAGGGAGPARADAAAAGADRQLARSASALRRRLHRVREDRGRLQDALTRGPSTSVDVVRDYLTRLAAVRSQRPDASRDAGAQPAGHRRSAGARTPSGRPAACAARSTAFRSHSRTTSTSWVCRRRAARGRWSTTVRASIRSWRPGCAARAPSCSARPTSTSFRSATSASAPSAAPSATPTTLAQHRGIERRQRGRRVHQPRDASRSGPTRATRCRTRRRSRRWRRSARRAA